MICYNKTMEQEIYDWFEEIKTKHIDTPDVKRGLGYARDLEKGLRLIRTYPQGVTIFGSARLPENDKYCIKARELGHLLANNGHTVITGGGPGIMEAANRGAYEYGGRSVGLNITLAHEQHPNPYLTDTMEFHYFFARKVMLTMSAKVYVFFPGGFGTLDEFSEVLELVKEGKIPPMPLFLFGKKFWAPLDRLFRAKMVPHGLIKLKDTKLYTITDDVTEIVKAANKIGHLKIRENLYDGYHGI